MFIDINFPIKSAGNIERKVKKMAVIRLIKATLLKMHKYVKK
jgi:hypothetical protein